MSLALRRAPEDVFFAIVGDNGKAKAGDRSVDTTSKRQ